MDFKSSFRVDATLVSNEFIDKYMASANGEYVKEYLFLLRHDGGEVTVAMIADALNHTEADVARALSYWKKVGVLRESVDNASQKTESVDKSAAEFKSAAEEETACAGIRNIEIPVVSWAGSTDQKGEAVSSDLAGSAALSRKSVSMAGQLPDNGKKTPRPLYSPEQISGLAGDEDFSQLLYIAQKYMNKVFTQRECEVFAYLYDGLHMSAEMLEYVVEYCVQGGHTSIRYIETVAINWHETGLKNVEEAKAYASSFTRDSFAVMRAFGLNDRKPADAERDMIDRWFKIYGFAKELVLEACNRTIEATHTPSFKYADKILSEWKKAGVRSLGDVKRLDEQHAERAKGKNAGTGEYKAAGNSRSKTNNQFQNFPQRDIDYDALVLQQLTEH